MWTLFCSGCRESWETPVEGPRPYRCAVCGLLEGWSQDLDWTYISSILDELEKHFPSAQILGYPDERTRPPWVLARVNTDPENGDEDFVITVLVDLPWKEIHPRRELFDEWFNSKWLNDNSSLPAVVDITPRSSRGHAGAAL